MSHLRREGGRGGGGSKRSERRRGREGEGKRGKAFVQSVQMAMHFIYDGKKSSFVSMSL